MSPAAIVSLLTLILVAAPVQEAAKPVPPKTFDEAVKARWTNDVKRWESLTARIVVMARDFPEDKMSFRFHPETRSFIEEVWHETFDHQILAARLKGTSKELDTKRLFSGEGRPRDRAGAARDLETVFAECAALLKKDPHPEVVASLGFYLEHAAVAYGKLVAMYRANGLVPPASRKAATAPGGGWDQ